MVSPKTSSAPRQCLNNEAQGCPQQPRDAVAPPAARPGAQPAARPQPRPAAAERIRVYLRTARRGLRDMEREMRYQQPQAYLAAFVPIRFYHLGDLLVPRDSVPSNRPPQNVMPSASNMHQAARRRPAEPQNNQQLPARAHNNPLNRNIAMRRGGVFVPVGQIRHGIRVHPAPAPAPEPAPVPAPARAPAHQPRVIARPAIIRNAVCERCDSHICILGMLAAQCANPARQEPNRQPRTQAPSGSTRAANEDDLIMVPVVSSTTYTVGDELQDEWPILL